MSDIEQTSRPELILDDVNDINMDDFAEGVDTNRLPATSDLTGQELTFAFTDGGSLKLALGDGVAHWTAAGAAWSGAGEGDFEEVRLDDGVYWLDFTIAERQSETVTVTLAPQRGWALVVHSVVHPEDFRTETRVTQTFYPASIAGAPQPSTLPVPTLELIGKRSIFQYSPNHLYEHVYFNSRRFAWHNLVGVAPGVAQVELATTYKLDDHLYLFTWRENPIPVATVFVFDYGNARSTGKFIGVTRDGAVSNTPGGAIITEFGKSDYSEFIAVS